MNSKKTSIWHFSDINATPDNDFLMIILGIPGIITDSRASLRFSWQKVSKKPGNVSVVKLTTLTKIRILLFLRNLTFPVL
tara:strand:- start:178 stop:417 length:240 start_codon:yes stop_codon:yes gene_type:complete